MTPNAGTPTPQLSVQLANFAATDPGGWEQLLVTAEAADAAGMDRVIVSDHVAFGTELDAYGRPELGGTEGGRQPTGPDGHWLEPLTVLTAIAARTQRVRLSTGILLAALRRPVVLAKTAATLDVLSGGRLDLGVGVGWQRAEYEAAGLDFDRRGALLDHSLEVCRALWSDGPAEHRSEFLGFSGIHQMPPPAQPGGVPIWVSGTVNRRVATRLARHGVGWITWGPAVSDPVGAIPAMRAAVADAGGDPGGFGVRTNLAAVRDPGGGIDVEATLAPVPALIEAGVTDVLVGARPSGDHDDQAAVFAALVDRFRELVGG